MITRRLGILQIIVIQGEIALLPLGARAIPSNFSGLEGWFSPSLARPKAQNQLCALAALREIFLNGSALPLGRARVGLGKAGFERKSGIKPSQKPNIQEVY
jgi:hypothetical protein